ncbi:MAG: HDIG domain-containing metalloprotein [Candidatus Omnitrophota bacterium]
MKKMFKENISVGHFFAGVLVFVVISGFCLLKEYPCILPLLLLFFSLHLFFIRKASPRLFLNLGLLIVFVVAMAHSVVIWGEWSPYYIPAASIGLLTMILFNDLELMFIMSLISSWVVTLIVGGDNGMLVTFFLGSLLGAYTIQNARRIGTIINAGLSVAFIQILCAVILKPEMAFFSPVSFLQYYIQPFVINGFVSAGITMISLKVFEKLFDVVTNFTLLELSDFNQPLLKQMILEAPGTYHHSLVVGNLSEAAADAIQADSLLTRVGAYYHDIGKMDKAEYFTENQGVSDNKHDDLEASVSKLVIINHVKNGIELAKKYRLNQKIINFIPQHHGTSLTFYFYQKALEDADSSSKVDEMNYRYPGPKPQTKETAIVLLADSVEAAARSLEDPAPKKIEELVRKIINNKFIDGQLDECNLTLKEIDQIASTFTKVLSATHHSRVKYPSKKGRGE